MATWYGQFHQGKRTSNGDIFDQERMTAASRSLPLGSHVRVTMQETGRSVVVLINDRMGAQRTAIDLSRGAARQIGLLARGRGAVTIASTTDEPVEVAEASDDDTAAPVNPTSRRPSSQRRHAAGRGPHLAAVHLGHHAT